MCVRDGRSRANDRGRERGRERGEREREREREMVNNSRSELDMEDHGI